MSSRSAVFTPGVDEALANLVELARFTGRMFTSLLGGPFHARAVLDQCYLVGVKTLPLVTLTGIITGVVFTQQSRPSLEAFGAASWLPSLITLALFRSLAPLVTALICAGKVGSSIGAELGSMKVTEQIEALEVSAIAPIPYLAVPRTIATTLMVPVLTTYFATVGFIGAYFNVAANEGTSWAAFVKNAFASLSMLDMTTSMTRALMFGFTVGLLSCYHGFTASRGTAGVGIAANKAVVQSMLLIFVEEVLFVQVVSIVRVLT